MRLYALRRRYGLYWKTEMPRIDWVMVIGYTASALLLVMTFALVDYITREDALVERVAVSEQHKVKAEFMLAHCMNGGSLMADGSMIMCGKAAMVKL